MRNMAEFQIIGNVGKIKEFPKNLKISIGSTYSRLNANKERENTPFWNEMTIWNPKTIEYIKKNVKQGMLVLTRGTMRQSSYDGPNGKVYTVDLSANEFSPLERVSDASEASEGEQPAERSAADAKPSDAPF